MLWPAMLFNLCAGLLLAGYLLRGVRRFERRADAIMAKLDRDHAARVTRLEAWADAEEVKYDIARDKIKAAMRAQVDQAIAEMKPKNNSQTSEQGHEVLFTDVSRFTQTAEENTKSIPTPDEIRKLPRWARVAFAARCARRVLPLYSHFRPQGSPSFVQALYKAVEQAEQLSLPGSTAPSKYAVYEDSFSVAAGDVHSKSATGVSDCVWHLADSFYPTEIPDAPSYLLQRSVEDANDAAHRIVSLTPHIRSDFEFVRRLSLAKDWTDGTPVPPSVFGPLWPEGQPAKWPKPDKPVTELVFTVDVPDDLPTADAVELVKELSAALCELHLAGGGHGLAIQPPLGFTTTDNQPVFPTPEQPERAPTESVLKP